MARPAHHRIAPTAGRGARGVSALAASIAALAAAVSPAGSAAARPQGAMTFQHVSGGPCPASGCILATGVIGPDAVRDFAAFARTTPVRPGALMLLNSRAGTRSRP
ncbi:hypothetical protein [Phenylobacterium sp. J367]|uniref:hypothetical protein n=1 Tax=Phenylobacterium sp. J367 TaxID=2898435 RepID=UPI002150D8D5|nr:hypothetical protein [Phenylobacterium sp. J367]MCR5877174.1 hypothetical protein [Phenylobacterium sp. J367]